MSPRVVISVEMLGEVPLPSAVQRAEFVAHLCGAHSWYKSYKYSPGLRTKFAVFLWRGADFDIQRQQHERTYQERHGCLAYGWRRKPTEPFSVDGARSEIELAPELVAAACVELEPYISSNYWVTTTCIAHYYRDRISVHPRRETLEELVACYDEHVQLWSTFSRETCDAICRRSDSDPRSGLPDEPGVARYLLVDQQLIATYYALQATEVAKIESAIDRMYVLREDVAIPS